MTTTYTHQSLTRGGYAKLLQKAFGERHPDRAILTADFHGLEYLNSPLGLIIHAYHGLHGCEAFYPASIDFHAVTGIMTGLTEIEPVPGTDANFVHHPMSRRTTGFLVQPAFGRMIHVGDPEAPLFEGEFQRLEVVESPAGLIVSAVRRSDIYVIHSSELITEFCAEEAEEPKAIEVSSGMQRLAESMTKAAKNLNKRSKGLHDSLDGRQNTTELPG